MVCPFRKRRVIEKSVDMFKTEKTGTAEYFCECYERDCPFYVPPTDTVEERCMRAEKEVNE